MWLFGHLFNMSYVIWSSGHLVIVSSGHLVILSSGFLVIWSFPILWKTVLFLWNTWIICGYSESCFGDLIEQSGYLVNRITSFLSFLQHLSPQHSLYKLTLSFLEEKRKTGSDCVTRFQISLIGFILFWLGRQFFMNILLKLTVLLNAN